MRLFVVWWKREGEHHDIQTGVIVFEAVQSRRDDDGTVPDGADYGIVREPAPPLENGAYSGYQRQRLDRPDDPGHRRRGRIPGQLIHNT